MATSLSYDADRRLLDFGVSLGAASRLFTAQQIARHAELSGRSQPERRAREFLRMHLDTFERLTAPRNEHIRWRLTRAARQQYGIHSKAIPAMTERAYHWLGVGDIYLEMAFNGGRPTEWRTEVDGEFDIVCKWRNQLLLIEYQRTPITSRMWEKKWQRRVKWYRAQKWNVKPTVVLINTTGQMDATINAPPNTVHIRAIEQLHNRIR